MSTLPLYVYGQGDLFAEYFNAVVGALGTSTYATLIKLTVALAGVTALVSSITRRDFMQCLRWFGLYYIVFYIFFLPKVSIEIIDRVNSNRPYTVDHVPLGLGVLASYTSVIGDVFTHLIESNFSLPDDLNYSRTGMVMASRMVIEASQFQVLDSSFNEALQDFLHQCVFYDLLLHKYTVDDVMTTSHLWPFFKEHSSPARAFPYRQQIVTCQVGAVQLENDWNRVIEQTSTRYARQLFPHTTEMEAKRQLFKYLPSSVGYLTQLSDSASSILQQTMMANAFAEGVIRFGATLSAPAALQSIAFSKAQVQKRLTNQTLGEMASYWLPLMKNAFEAIMYGSFLIVFLLMLFPFGMMILRNYLFTLLWLQMWAPLFAIIHLMISFYARSGSQAISPDGLTLQSLPGLLQVNTDMAGLAGYLSLSVPFLAGGLVKGMSGTFTQLAQYIGGVTQSAGSSAAAEVVSGNLSMGNTNFSNHSAFNTSANHWDTSARSANSISSFQVAGGSTLSMSSDGTAVMDNRGAISSLGTSINLAESVRSVASQQADQAYATSLSQAHTYSSSINSALRELYELGGQKGITMTDGASSSITTSTGTSTALTQLHQLTDKFAKENNLTYAQAIEKLGNAYWSWQVAGELNLDKSAVGHVLEALGVNGSVSANTGNNHQRNDSHTQQENALFSKAQNYLHNTDFSRTLDVALRGMQERSYRSQTEDGQRLIDHIGSSLDQAKQARQEMLSNYQKSESYHKAASLAEENALSINSNASQLFIEWMQNQPGSDGRGHMGLRTAEYILSHEPELAQTYAKQFSEQQAQSIVSQFQSNSLSSPQQVLSTYTQNNQSIPSAGAVQTDYQRQKNTVSEKVLESGVMQSPRSGPQLINEVNQLFDKNSQKIAEGNTIVEQGKTEITNTMNIANNVRTKHDD